MKHIPTFSIAVLSLVIGTVAVLSGFSVADGVAERGSFLPAPSYTVGEPVLDRFGVRMLHPTSPDGRVWRAKWDNTFPRALSSGMNDPFDPEFVARGEGTVMVDGHGIASVTGVYPRLYVYDPLQKETWNNVEVTVYGKRVSETERRGSQGIIIGARSEHQDVTSGDPCNGYTYYGKLLYDGRAIFQKELVHGEPYSDGKPYEDNSTNWGTQENTMPVGEWIGLKFIVRTNSEDDSVTLELYRDLTDGHKGGLWEKVATYTDTGGWFSTDDLDTTACMDTYRNVLFLPGTSVFVRNDFIERAEYKYFSIREIEG